MPLTINWDLLFLFGVRSIRLHRNNVCFQKTKSNPMLSKVITQAGCGGVIRDVLSNSVQGFSRNIGVTSSFGLSCRL